MLDILPQSRIFIFDNHEILWEYSIRTDFQDYNCDNSLCKDSTPYYEFCLFGHNINHMKIFADKIKQGKYELC